MRLHPVYSGSLLTSLSGTQQLVVAAGGGTQGVSRVGVSSAVRVLPNAQACRCSDENSLSTRGGVCKTCGFVLLQYGAQTCGSECWQALGSRIKMAMATLGGCLLGCMVLDVGGCAALWCKTNGWVQPGSLKILAMALLNGRAGSTPCMRWFACDMVRHVGGGPLVRHR